MNERGSTVAMVDLLIQDSYLWYLTTCKLGYF